VLANFLVKFCNFPEEEELPQGETWVACVDESPTRKYSGVSVILIAPSGEICEATVKRYLTKVKEAIEDFDKIVFKKVPWEENAKVDS
jgi:hypothetical protein